MKKNPPSYRDEMVDLRERMANLETKLSLINEPLLVDALSYELLGLRARLNFLISRAKAAENTPIESGHNAQKSARMFVEHR